MFYTVNAQASTEKHPYNLIHTHIHYSQFSLFNSPIAHVFGQCGKPEHPEETHANTGGTETPHKMLTGPARSVQLSDLSGSPEGASDYPLWTQLLYELHY